MQKTHAYALSLVWTGNTGTGTNSYKAFERSYMVSGHNKPQLHGSSDPAFRGDKTKYNPEELLLASLSSCHMLWYLHLCADAGVIVVSYDDNPTGTMIETEDGGGRFEEVVLQPVVKVKDASMIEKANDIHKLARAKCFIANSVNFTVRHVPEILLA